jgi:hypothetical protein
VSNGESTKIRLGAPVYQDAQHVICVCQNTVLTYSGDAPNPRYLDAWARTVQLVAEQYPTGVLVITLIDRHAHVPDDASKAHIRNTVLRHADQIGAFAYVVEGEGFGAAAVRSALSLISLAARYPFPQKVFGRAEDAVPWMLSRPGRQGERHTQDAAKLIGVANSLRGLLRLNATVG